MSARSLQIPATRELAVSRRRLLVLSLASASLVPAAVVPHLQTTFPTFERTIEVSRRDAVLARLDSRVIAAARKQDWFRQIDIRHLRLLEWLAAGHENIGGIEMSAPALGSTFGHSDIPIVTAGMFDVDRQLEVLNRNMFLFLADRPVIFSSDNPLPASDLGSVKSLVARWFPEVEVALAQGYPYAGTHIELNVANSRGRATARGANMWLSPDFSSLPHAFVHERIHSYQYTPDDALRFPVFASEGSTEVLASLLTGTSPMWQGDGGKVDLELRGSSPAGDAYAAQSYNGYDFFAELLRIMGRTAFLSAIQQVYAGTQARTGAEVLAAFRRAAPNAYAVDALCARSVDGYEKDEVALYGSILPPLRETALSASQP